MCGCFADSKFFLFGLQLEIELGGGGSVHTGLYLMGIPTQLLFATCCLVIWEKC